MNDRIHPMKHGLLHILGCLIPIALIFLLPALGVGSGVTFTAFIILMFACHLFMMGGHGHGGHGGPHNHETATVQGHDAISGHDHTAAARNSEAKGKQSCH